MDAIPTHAGVGTESGVVSGGAGIVRHNEDEALDGAELGVDLCINPSDSIAVTMYEAIDGGEHREKRSTKQQLV